MSSTPLISIVTPVGPRHAQHALTAHASTHWQTVPADWVEHICVFDRTRKGPATARNAGIAAARGLFLVCLDADDYLMPDALEIYLRHFAQSRASYVYGDNYVYAADGSHHLSSSYEYRQAHIARYNQHVVTALVPLSAARQVGGFDTAIDAWEDWTLWMRLAIAGYCGDRVPAPCLVYRMDQGGRMHVFLADSEGNIKRMTLVTERYTNAQGVIEMAGCCGGFDPERLMAHQMVAALPRASDAPNGVVRLQYIGAQEGSFILTSPHSRQSYKLGRGRLVDVAPEFTAQDVPWLEAFRAGDGAPVVRRVPAVTAFVPPPILDLSADLPFAELAPDAIVLEV